MAKRDIHWRFNLEDNYTIEKFKGLNNTKVRMEEQRNMNVDHGYMGLQSIFLKLGHIYILYFSTCKISQFEGKEL